MSSTTLEIPKHTRTKQQQAANPTSSVWVGANAGSGKTYVLAERVIRLLLAGNPPEKILCLSYTKAAAAEMANRVLARLSTMATQPDSELASTLSDITASPTRLDEMADARCLFARAIETPGGLKIQTIHAFCERILHRFPFETGIPAHFSVIEDQERNHLLSQALNGVIASVSHNQHLAMALDVITSAGADLTIKRALYDLMAAAGQIEPESLRLELGQIFNVTDTPQSLEHNWLKSPYLSPQKLNQISTTMAKYSASDQALRFGQLVINLKSNDAILIYQSIFLTTLATPRKRLYPKIFANNHPDLARLLDLEQQRIVALKAEIAGAQIVASTCALATFAKQVNQQYQKAKRQRGLVDYDDLIHQTAKLLARSNDRAWVQYKLDQNLDHILIDEAQDTSPEQWHVIAQLAKEFFINSTAVSRPRTIFAVGDEKQSIYSFQGADPAGFSKMRKLFAKHAAENQKTVKNIMLNLSFRSTPEILQGVDRVFSTKQRHQTLSQSGIPVHEALRINDHGFIEIWPEFITTKDYTFNDWDTPLDTISQTNAGVRLAQKIAEKISFLLEGKTILPSTGKPAIPGDIMILLQRRKGYADTVIKTLKQANIPVAGADRLLLTEHIGVQDLISLGEALTSDVDDLALAITLRSPLINLSEDDLFEIAHDRKDAGLWQALAAKRHQSDRFLKAYQTLKRWREAASTMRPFEFYSWILGCEKARKALFSRLTLEAEDVINEFLNLALKDETANPPHLLGFIKRLKQADYQVKRDMDIRRNMVRVMTIHGAKGLEAPIIFLADTGKIPTHHHDPEIVRISGDHQTLPAWRLPGVKHQVINDALTANRNRQNAEYNRLLYVAMTRAGDYLYVGAARGSQPLSKNCWYQMIKSALQDEAMIIDDGWPEGEILRWCRAQSVSRTTTPTNAKDVHPKSSPQIAMPKWLTTTTNIKQQIGTDRAHPSALRSSGDLSKDVVLPNDPNQMKMSERGIIIHRLIAQLVASKITDTGQLLKLLARLINVAELSQDDEKHQNIYDELRAIIEKPSLAIRLFGQNAICEAPFIAQMSDKTGKAIEVSGRIDLLINDSQQIDLVDFKTTLNPPLTIKDCSQQIIDQMALYRAAIAHNIPAKPVTCHLLWTATTKAMTIPNELLDDAFTRLGWTLR